MIWITASDPSCSSPLPLTPASYSSLLPYFLYLSSFWLPHYYLLFFFLHLFVFLFSDSFLLTPLISRFLLLFTTIVILVSLSPFFYFTSLSSFHLTPPCIPFYPLLHHTTFYSSIPPYYILFLYSTLLHLIPLLHLTTSLPLFVINNFKEMHWQYELSHFLTTFELKGEFKDLVR